MTRAPGRHRAAIAILSAALVSPCGAPAARAAVWRPIAAVGDSAAARLSATLPAAALHPERAASFGRVIEPLPGARAATHGLAAGRPMVRGLAGARLPVLDDGVRLEDATWSDEDGPALEPGAGRRVDVVRGALASLESFGALWGVVRVTPEPLPDGGFGASPLRVRAESWGATERREGGGALRLEGAADRIGWRVAGLGRGSSGLRAPVGLLPDTRFDARDGEAAVGFRDPAGDAAVRVSHTRGASTLVALDGPPFAAGVAAAPVVRRTVDDTRARLDAGLNFSGVRLATRVEWQRHRLDARPSLAPATLDRTTIEATTFEVRALAGRGALRGTLGASAAFEADAFEGAHRVVPDAHQSTGGLFALGTTTAGRFDVTAGVRADVRHVDAAQNLALALRHRRRTDALPAAGVGVAWRAVESLTWIAGIGGGWRPPALDERYAFGARLAGGRFVIGDLDAAPERLRGVDLALRWARPRWHGELSWSRARVRDFLVLAPTVELHDSLPVDRWSAGDATVLATEAWTSLELGRSLTLRARADYVRGEHSLSGEPLPSIPPLLGGARAELALPAPSWLRSARVAFEAEGEAKAERRAAWETSVPAWAMLHADGTLAWGGGARAFAVDVRLANLTNARVRRFVGGTRYWAMEPGRGAELRVRWGS